MQIPKNLPQFEKLPALFIASGEYEAEFYLASGGNFNLWKKIDLPPREEAKEKQGFIGKKAGKKDLASVSHKGRYIEDLKKKFQKNMHSLIHEALAEFKLREIYVFAPKYAAKRIENCLDEEEKKKIRMEFFGEDTKKNPLFMIKKFSEEEKKKIFPRQVPSNGAKKILSKPKVKRKRL